MPCDFILVDTCIASANALQVQPATRSMYRMILAVVSTTRTFCWHHYKCLYCGSGVSEVHTTLAQTLSVGHRLCSTPRGGIGTPYSANPLMLVMAHSMNALFMITSNALDLVASGCAHSDAHGTCYWTVPEPGLLVAAVYASSHSVTRGVLYCLLQYQANSAYG